MALRSDWSLLSPVPLHCATLSPLEPECLAGARGQPEVGQERIGHAPGSELPGVHLRERFGRKQVAVADQVELTEDVLARLDAIWPGPGGAAPEAYAW